MELLFVLFWYSVEYNFSIASAYIKSEDDNACDTLSRLNEPCATLRLRKLTLDKFICCGTLFSEPFLSS